MPSKSQTGNVKSYFSGHYQTYGINVQAACDHKCRLCMQPLLHLGEQMILQHLKNTIQSDGCISQSLLWVRIHYACSETLLLHFQVCKKMNQQRMHSIFT